MSECGCVYGSEGEWPVGPIQVRTVGARKSHQCCECGDAIPIGATFELVTGIWDFRDGIRAYKTCATCAEIRGLLFCAGWSYGWMWEDIRESWGAGNRVAACIDKCESVAAKEKLATEWRKHMEIDPR